MNKCVHINHCTTVNSCAQNLPIKHPPDQLLIVQRVGRLAALDVDGALVQLESDGPCHPVLTLGNAETSELALRAKPETCSHKNSLRVHPKNSFKGCIEL